MTTYAHLANCVVFQYDIQVFIQKWDHFYDAWITLMNTKSYGVKENIASSMCSDDLALKDYWKYLQVQISVFRRELDTNVCFRMKQRALNVRLRISRIWNTSPKLKKILCEFRQTKVQRKDFCTAVKKEEFEKGGKLYLSSGWKRVYVIRKPSDLPYCKKGDIYYVAPGCRRTREKRLRSTPEIINTCKNRKTLQ